LPGGGTLHRVSLCILTRSKAGVLVIGGGRPTDRV